MFICMMALSLLSKLELTMDQIAIPRVDPYGRYATLNKMGKVDSNPNEVTQAFVDWSIQRARNTDEVNYRKMNYVLEVGGGYGFVAREAIAGGAWYIFNDVEPDHIKIAERIFPESGHPSQVETFAGRFPNEELTEHIQRFYPLVGIGSFSVIHFMRGREIRNLLDVFWDLLRPGGRVFLTAGTPWNGLFRGYPPEYRRRKDAFLRDPSRHAYPGEMEDAARYLPQDQYPPFFHALDGDTLSHLAQSNPEKRFEIVRVVPIERPLPPEQAYRRGYRRGQTEIIGIILEKPGQNRG